MLIEIGVFTLEEALQKCTVNSGREKRMVIRRPQIKNVEGKDGTKTPVKLDKDKHYQILFIIKNREGSANRYQVVIEHDMSRNIIKEVGITNVPVDF